MNLIFEISEQGKRCATIRKPDVQKSSLAKKYLRSGNLELPEVSEVDFARHYTALSRRAFGVKINEEVAGLEGFTRIHPLQPQSTVQGALEVMETLQRDLAEITGMDAVTLQPNAGAHGEYTGLQLIAAYHTARKDFKRTKVIVPDSAHGTNPASAVMAGFEIINVPSDEEKGVDLKALKAVVGEDTAALMLTNPTTLGLFEKNIKEISKIIHGAGGLLYYDGANLNAVMGIVRPGDMGFDVVHLNLHKTFSTPHGGGGPGSGPVGCKKELAAFLPGPIAEKTARGSYRLVECKKSIGKVASFYGNFGVYVRALAYIVTLGAEGIKSCAQHAVLNANYLKANIEDLYPTEKGRHCMHEFVVSMQELKDKTGVSAMDIAKTMIDRGYHPPTMYFPLIIHEALMFEPTETENKRTLDEVIKALREIYEEAFKDPEYMKAAPHHAQIGRPDEVRAARQPIVKYTKE